MLRPAISLGVKVLSPQLYGSEMEEVSYSSVQITLAERYVSIINIWLIITHNILVQIL